MVVIGITSVMIDYDRKDLIGPDVLVDTVRVLVYVTCAESVLK